MSDTTLWWIVYGGVMGLGFLSLLFGVMGPVVWGAVLIAMVLIGVSGE